MRKAISLLTVVLFAGLLGGCGGNNPKSYQDLVFDAWVRQGAASEARFAEITMTKTGDLQGTFVAIVEGTDEEGNPDTATMQGTVVIQHGSTLILSGGVAGQPAGQTRFTFSIDDDVLTLTPDFGGSPELYVRK